MILYTIEKALAWFFDGRGFALRWLALAFSMFLGLCAIGAIWGAELDARHPVKVCRK